MAASHVRLKKIVWDFGEGAKGLGGRRLEAQGGLHGAVRGLCGVVCVHGVSKRPKSSCCS